MAEILAQRGRMIVIDPRYRNISETRGDEVGMHRGIDMDQHAVGGKTLGAMAGDGVPVIEMPVVPIRERNGPAVVEMRGDCAVSGDVIDGGKIAVGILQAFVGSGK